MIGLAGVLLGACLQAIFNFELQRRAENRRSKREDTNRLRDERISAYSALVEATINPPTEEQFKTISEAFSRVELTGSADVAAAALMVLHTYELWKDQYYERVGEQTQTSASEDQYEATMNEALRSRDKFLNLARKELQIDDKSET